MIKLCRCLIAFLLLCSTGAADTLPPGSRLLTVGIPPVGHPALGPDGTLYLSGRGGLHALDTYGKIRWSGFTNDPDIYPLAGVSIAPDHSLRVGINDNSITALNPDGSIRWSYPAVEPSYSTLSIGADGATYGGNFSLIAINADGTLRWKYLPGFAAHGPSAIAGDGTVYFGSMDFGVYAVKPDGTLKWRYATAGYVQEGPALGTDGTVYIGSGDKNLYALKPDGTLRWKYTSEDSPTQAVVGPDGILYFGNGRGFLTALRPDGTLQWKFSTQDKPIWLTPSLAADGSVVVVGDVLVFGVSPSGTERWRFDAQTYLVGPPLIGLDGAVHLAISQFQKAIAIAGTAPSTQSAWPTFLGGSFHDGRVQTSTPAAPQMVAPPRDQIATNDASLVLRVEATGVPTPTWQWRHGGVPIAGATNAIYFRATVASVDNGAYDVIVANNHGAITSAPVTVSVISPPFITSQPKPAVVRPGASTTLEVVAGGTAPLGYRWLFNDNPVSGANASTLGLPNFQAANEGLYSVIVTNVHGSITSAPVRVTLLVPGVIRWTLNLPQGLPRIPAIAPDGTMYFGGGGGDPNFYAVSPAGLILWTYPLGNNVGGSTMIGPDGTLYFGQLDGTVTALRSDGTLRWTYKTAGLVLATPALGRDGSIHIGSSDGMYTLNPDGTLKWKVPFPANITSSAAVGSDGTLYFGGNEGKFHALNPDGSEKWSYQIGPSVSSSPALGADGTVYFGADDQKIYALNADGSLRWFYSAPGGGGSPVIGVDGTIYCGSGDGKLHAITPAGLRKWVFPVDEGSPSIAVVGSTGTLYFCDRRTLYALKGTGELEWKLTDGEQVTTGPQITPDGGIIFGGRLQKLVAVEAAGTLAPSPWPTFHRNLQFTGQGMRLPEIRMDAPLPGESHVTGETIGIRVQASSPNGAIARIVLVANKTNLAVLPAGQLSFDWVVVVPGDYTLTATAIDSAGARQSTPPVTLSVLTAGTKPFITLQPSDQRTTNGATVLVEAGVQGSLPLGFQWYKDGLAVPGAMAPHLNLANVSLSDSARYFLTAQNAAGSVTSSIISVSVLQPVPEHRETEVQFLRYPPAIGPDGNIYAIADTELRAFDRDGGLLWRYGKVGQQGPSISTENRILLPGYSDNYVSILPDGTKLWDTATGAPASGASAIGADGRIFFGTTVPFSRDGHVRAMAPDGTPLWDYPVVGEIYGTPAIAVNGDVHIGAGTNLLCLSGDGHLKWSFATRDRIESSPAIGNDGTVYFGSLDGRFRAVTPAGALQWELDANGPVASAPCIGTDGTIYVSTLGNQVPNTPYTTGRLLAVSPGGAIRWDFPVRQRMHSSPAVAADGTIYVGSDPGVFFAINANGTEKWEYPGGGGFQSGVTIGPDGTVYFGASLMIAFAAGTPPATSVWPMSGRDYRHRGRASGGRAPIVSITAPQDNASVPIGTKVGLAVSVMETDEPVQKVQWLLDGAAVATANWAPYSADWKDPAIGDHQLIARVTDRMGAVTDSPAVTFSIVPPVVVTLSSPGGGDTFVAGDPIPLRVSFAANAPAIVQVTYYDGPTPVDTVSTAPFSKDWNNASVGPHLLTARATDAQGLQLISAPVGITVLPRPPISLTAPTARSVFTPGTAVTLAADVSGDANPIQRVEFLANGLPVGSAATAPFQFTWHNSAPGPFQLTARSIDTANHTNTSAPLTVWFFAYGTQAVDFVKFNSGTGILTQGDATVADNRLSLTTGGNNQSVGAAWIDLPVFLMQGFECVFQFRTTNRVAGGGAGLAMVIQGNPLPVSGRGGSGIGYEGIPRSLAIEFDSHQDAVRQDPGSHQVGVHTRHLEPNSADEAFAIASVAGEDDFTDGRPRRVHVVYTPGKRDGANREFGTLSVTIEPRTSPDLNLALDLDEALGLVNGGAWIGLTAANGPGSETHEIMQWKFNAIAATPVITEQPPATTVVVGGATTTLSVKATGLAPLQYQWQFNGTALPGRTESTLTLTAVQPSQTGDYTVEITNPAGRIVSRAAHVEVTLDGTVKWQYQGLRAATSPLAMDTDGALYFGATGSGLGDRLISLAADGHLRWEVPSHYTLTAAPVISARHVLYVVSYDHHLYAVDNDGHELWSFVADGALSLSPALGTDETIHIITDDGHLYAVRPDGAVAWDYETHAAVHGSPVIGADGTVYFGDVQHRFHALNPDGTARWTYTAGGEIHSAPAIGPDGSLHFSAFDGKHYVLNPDGTLKWTAANAASRLGPMVAPDGSVYIASGKDLRALDAQGGFRWIFPTGDVLGAGPTVAANGTIFLGSPDGRLYALRPDGTTLWSVPVGNGIYAPGTLIGPDGTLYAATGDGRVIAFRGSSPLASTGWPTFHRDLARTGAVPPSGPPVLTLQPLPQTLGAGTNLALRVSATGAQPLGYKWRRNGITLQDGDNISGSRTPTLVITGTRLDQGGYYTVLVTNSAGVTPSMTARVTVVPFYQPPGTVIWSRQLASQILTSPARGPNGDLYFSNEADELVAVDAKGADRWKFPAGTRCSAAVVDPAGVIYFSADQPANRFLAVYPDGTKKWEVPLQVNTLSVPVITYDGRIYVTSGDGLLNALNPDGSVIWSTQLGTRFNVSPPSIGRDGTIFIGAGHPDPLQQYTVGDCLALYPDGSIAWKFSTRGPFASPAIGRDNSVYFAAEQTFAFDRLGHPLWKDAEPTDYYWGPVSGPDGTVLTTTGLALSANGTRKWRGISRTPGALGSDGAAHLVDQDGNLRSYNPEGKLQWVTNINSFGVAIAPILTPEGILYAARGNVLMAVQASAGLAASGWPMGMLNPARNANLQLGPVPIVVITAPVDGFHVRGGSDIPLEVRFPATGVGVDTVSYRLDGRPLATASAPPFATVWRNAAFGTHRLSAVVIDANSISNPSVEVTVVVSDPPHVVLQQPVDGSIYLDGDNVVLAAEAFDNDGSVARVDFFRGDALIGSVTTRPYRLVWRQPAPGVHHLHARAIDDSGDSTVTPEIGIVVDALPTVSLVQPLDNTTTGDTHPIRLAAEAADADDTIARVDFHDGSTLLGSVGTAPYEWTVQQPSTGSHYFHARAFDTRGGSARSGVATVLVNPPDQPPAITFVSPFHRAHVAPGIPVPVSVTALDSGGPVASLDLLLDDALVAGPSAGSSVQWSWTDPKSGNHRLTARATDNQGNVATRSIDVSVVEPGADLPAPLLPSAENRPALWTPDGPVHALFRTNGTLYIGGEFTHVGQLVSGNSVIEVSAAAPDLTQPAVDTLIDTLIGDERGGYYVGGLFNTMGGVPRRNLAHVNADRSVDLAFRADSDGHVLTLTLANGVLYAGGEFRNIGGLPQRYVAALNPITGEVLPWNPAPTDWVGGIAVGDGVVYLGGNFEYVGGDYRDYIAAVSATDGVALAWDPGADKSVGQLLLAGGRLYAVGQFGRMGGTARNGVAALDPVTGALDAFYPAGIAGAHCLTADQGILYAGGSSFVRGINPATGATVLNVTVTGVVYGLEVSGDTVYLDGDFTQVNGIARKRVAAVNRTTGAVSSLDLNPSGRFVVMGKSGGKVFAAGQIGLIQVPRRGLAAIDEATGFATSWNPGTDGAVYAFECRGDELYVGGQFNNLAGEPRDGLGAVSRTTGRATGWRTHVVNVRSLLLSEESLFAGGYFNLVGDVVRNHMVEVDLRSGRPTDWNPDADGAVLTMARVGDTLYLGGEFTQIGGKSRNHAAAVNPYSGKPLPWNPDLNGFVVSLAARDGFLLAGGGFNQVGGRNRRYLAALDAETGLAADWFPEADGGVLALRSGGALLYVAGQFAHLGGVPRLNLGAIDGRSFPPLVTPWNPGPGTDPSDAVIHTILVTESSLYAGGRFRTPTPNLVGYDFPARAESPVLLPADLFRLNFHGPLGYFYVFEASTNLVDWSPILTNKPPLLFEDLDAFRHPARFYRARPLQ